MIVNTIFVNVKPLGAYNMNDHELIINRLYKLLNDRDMSINRLSQRSGVKQSTISSLIQRPTGVPKADTLRLLCEGLGISVKEFFDFPPYNQRTDDTSVKEEESKWEKLGNALTPDEKERVRKILNGEI